ncbi:hypothetical protein [Streptomyces sp. NPDC004721]
MLAVVRALREYWSPASAEELEQLETDVLAGLVLARASAGLADGTIRGDIGFDEKTAMRYADSARALLQQAAEQQLQWKLLEQHVLSPDHEQMTPAESAASILQDNAALWSMGEIRASDVVSVACDALVAGLDSPALRILAACTRAEADNGLPDLLPPALDELGLAFYPVGSVAGQEAAARARPQEVDGAVGEHRSRIRPCRQRTSPP